MVYIFYSFETSLKQGNFLKNLRICYKYFTLFLQFRLFQKKFFKIREQKTATHLSVTHHQAVKKSAENIKNVHLRRHAERPKDPHPTLQ